MFDIRSARYIATSLELLVEKLYNFPALNCPGVKLSGTVECIE